MEIHDEGMRRITVEVPASLHIRFKTEVNRQGLDIRAVIIPLVKSWLSGESKIKIQPIGQSFETRIHPDDVGWEKSVEKLVNEILESHKREEMKEAEAGAAEVHTIEKPAKVEEPVLEEIEEPEEIELEEIEPESGPEEIEPVRSGPEEQKPKKKKRVGVWPWTREVDVEEKPKEEKPKKKHGFWTWR